MDKYKKLVNNSIIFAVGNFGSKFINVFMVPLYTYVLSTKEYGKIDLATTTIFLLIPFLTLSLDQAVLRYVMAENKKASNESIISTVLATFFLIFIVTVIVLTIPFLYFNIMKGMRTYFLTLLFLNGLQSLVLQYSRGIGLIKEYAINGILQTIVFAGLNVVLMLILKLGINGYFLSMIFSLIVSVIYLYIVCKGWLSLKIYYIKFELLNEMLRYSIPLIPNGTMWWIVSNATRYVILAILGPTANGLFAVGSKLPSIISSVTGIFTQAWQLSAFEEYDSDNKEIYYSVVFKYYYQVLFIVSSGILIVVIPFVKYAISPEFFDSWMIIPTLIFGIIYQTLAGFLGSIYTASMNTKGVFFSSFLGAIISIIVDIFAIYFFGIMGAGIGTAIGFFIMWYIRLIDTRKLVYTNINYKNFVSNNVVFMIQTIVIYATHSNLIVTIIIESMLFLFLVFVNRNILTTIFRLVCRNQESRKNCRRPIEK